MRIESANKEKAGYYARTAIAYWIGAALVLACIVIINRGPLIVDFSSRDFNPIVFMPVIIAMVGVFYLALAVRDWLRAGWFGTSVLEVDEVYAGDRVHGILRTARDLNPTSDFVLRLQCIQSKEIAIPDRNGFMRHTIVDDVLCELTHKVNGQNSRSSVGIPLNLTLPGNLPPTHGYAGVKGSIRWALIAEAPLAGLNYNAVFRIPVRSRSDEHRQ
jgi:hypothetical protein